MKAKSLKLIAILRLGLYRVDFNVLKSYRKYLSVSHSTDPLLMYLFYDFQN